MFVKGQRIGCWESWWWEGQVTLVMHGQGHNFWTKLLENVLESSGKFLFVFILVATPRIYETAKSEGFGELKAARRGCCFFFFYGEWKPERRDDRCFVGQSVRLVSTLEGVCWWCDLGVMLLGSLSCIELILIGNPGIWKLLNMFYFEFYKM